ncbi:MAG TPA: AraC family transcriptional regulator [Burkholderiales bacterium]|nr:AraC family transcriptional regulator [Burkholderiales bacterium]
MKTLSILGALALAGNLAGAAEPPKSPPRDPQALDTRIQSLKQEAMDLNRDLLVLEEELLFPASTQVAVFVSVDVGALFDLDSVELKLDDSVVTNYLYTEREVRALHRGGVQRLYMGNLRTGKHELIAVFVGKGPKGRDYRRGTSLKFEKGTDPKYIELQIRDDTRGQQPDFRVKEW